MKIQRTKNAARNMVYGSALKMLNMVIPFIMRSILLYYLGVEYLGLSGLFRSILSFLNLAELGVGSAMVFSMYKPIVEDDTDTICALLKLYRTFYRIIGLFIAIVGIVLTPFLRNLISGNIPPDMNLYVLYYMNLFNTVLTYWLFAYKSSLLNAHQRTDVISKVSLSVQIIEYLLKVISLVIFKSYYIYLAIQLLAQVAINLITAARVSKMYPKYFPQGDMPRDKMISIIHRVRDLFTAKFAYVVFNSADTLVISAFLGLTSLAIYQNYYFVITALTTFLNVLIHACQAGIGNSLMTESKEKNSIDLSRYTILFGWVMCVGSTMLLCMYQPFMQIWMGKVNMLTSGHVICFVIYFFTTGMNKVINMFKDAAGIWKRDRFRPLTAALVNLLLNLISVQRLGVYGVLLSSIIAVVLIEIPWLFHNLFQEVYPHEYLLGYLKLFFSLTAVALCSCAGAWYICSIFMLDVWPTLIINACISFAISNISFYAFYGTNKLFRESVKQILNVVLKKSGSYATKGS